MENSILNFKRKRPLASAPTRNDKRQGAMLPSVCMLSEAMPLPYSVATLSAVYSPGFGLGLLRVNVLPSMYSVFFSGS